jgi:putative SOS response-associated peptidase YedK
MCGRFTQKTAPAELVEAFELDAAPIDLGERYNIAPSQTVLVVANLAGPRRALPMQWGLRPRWVRDARPDTAGPRLVAHPLANARAESLDQRPSFRDALHRRRGLLLMDGFYEWRTDGRHKLPYYFTLADGEPFAVAALWERPLPAQGEPLLDSALPTTCLITTAPHPLVAEVHDRMPVILPRAAWPMWLDPKPRTARELQDLLVPWHGQLAVRQVTRWVNDAAHEGPQCLDPPAHDDAALRQGRLI